MNTIDLTGQTFGRLTVLKQLPWRNNGKIMWICKCECGNETVVTGTHLRYGKTKSCGCLYKEVHSNRMKKYNAEHPVSKRFIDLMGQRFGRLIVIQRADNSKTGNTRWLCQCDCGKQTIVLASKLRSGHTQSCGCLGIEHATQAKIKHGGSKTKLYRIFSAMLRRCNNSNTAAYKHYGGRGIKVCEEWKTDFSLFREWANNNGYTEGLTIDRIDVNGNYEPSNCRWITHAEQMRNKRDNVKITYNGKTLTAAEWEKHTGIKQTTIAQRFHNGWSSDEIFNKPIIGNAKLITCNGEEHSITAWAKILGIDRHVISRRLNRGEQMSDIVAYYKNKQKQNN